MRIEKKNLFQDLCISLKLISCNVDFMWHTLSLPISVKYHYMYLKSCRDVLCTLLALLLLHCFFFILVGHMDIVQTENHLLNWLNLVWDCYHNLSFSYRSEIAHSKKKQLSSSCTIYHPPIQFCHVNYQAVWLIRFTSFTSTITSVHLATTPLTHWVDNGDEASEVFKQSRRPSKQCEPTTQP